jgi:chitin-binding protein
VLPSGAEFQFRFRQSIPHVGTFRLYVTSSRYRPTRPLRWSDLEAKPFLTVTNPPLANDTYLLRGRLPAGRTGRHLIYTVWQNADTPDTYYSCSDVVFVHGSGVGPATGVVARPAGAQPGPGQSGPGGVLPAQPGAGQPGPVQPGIVSPTGAVPATTVPGQSGTAVASAEAASGDGGGDRNTPLPLAVGGAAMLLAAAAPATVLLRRRRG